MTGGMNIVSGVLEEVGALHDSPVVHHVPGRGATPAPGSKRQRRRGGSAGQ